MLGAQGPWAGRDLYRTTPAVTRGLGFSGLIRRTAPFSRLLQDRSRSRILYFCVRNWSLFAVLSLNWNLDDLKDMKLLMKHPLLFWYPLNVQSKKGHKSCWEMNACQNLYKNNNCTNALQNLHFLKNGLK
jgi:hypothetical protein